MKTALPADRNDFMKNLPWFIPVKIAEAMWGVEESRREFYKQAFDCEPFSEFITIVKNQP